MSTAPSIKQDALYKKAQELVESVVVISEKLPTSDLYMLKDRLKESVSHLTKNIEKSFKQEKKIDQLRAYITTNGNLAECKDYLELIKQLKYADTDKVLDKIDEVGQLLKYSNGKFH